MRAARRPNRRRAIASPIVIFDVMLMLFTVGALMYTYLASGVKVVPAIASSELKFWNDRASELCTEPSQRPKFDLLPADADPVAQLSHLGSLLPKFEQVWKSYEKCQEPKKITLPEDLLHFKVDKSDEFESDPENAFRTMRNYIDQHAQTHDLIYVLGHTDDTGTDEHNNTLSYNRALRIVQEIRTHLVKKRFVARKDYMLFPVGMGESQLVSNTSGEDLTQWRKRCRRIEIELRSSKAPGKTGAQ